MAKRGYLSKNGIVSAFSKDNEKVLNFVVFINWESEKDTRVRAVLVFFLSGFSFTDTDNSRDSRVREGTIFYFTLPISPAHEHSHIYLQV